MWMRECLGTWVRDIIAILCQKQHPEVTSSNRKALRENIDIIVIIILHGTTPLQLGHEPSHSTLQPQPQWHSLSDLIGLHAARR